LENPRIYYPVNVPALTAGQYATVTGWWYEQKNGCKYKYSSYLFHSITQFQLKVWKVFGNDLDRDCRFGRQQAVKLRKLTSDTVV